MHLEKETFGPVLRAARERRGISLKQLSLETKLSADLWEALEESNLERWPKRIFVRSYLRDYALRVGLNAEEVVDEFCRLFPEWGDRRAEHVIRGKADIIAHDLSWEDLPVKSQRRASDLAAQGAPGFAWRHRARIIAVSIDLVVMFGLGFVGAALEFTYWRSIAVGAVSYSVLGTSLIGRSFGAVVSDWLLRQVMSLPAMRRLVSSRAQGA